MATRWNYDEIEKMKDDDGMSWADIADAVGSDNPTKLMQNYHSFKQRQNKKQIKLATTASSTDLEKTITDLKQRIASLEELKQNLRVVSELQQQILTLEAEVAELQSSTNVVGDENLTETASRSTLNEKSDVDDAERLSDASESVLDASAKDFAEHFQSGADDDDDVDEKTEFMNGDGLVTAEQYAEIKRLIEDGYDEDEVADMLDLPKDTVYDVEAGIFDDDMEMDHDFLNDDV